MTATPRFQMLGDADALVCEDGVCAAPEAPAGDPAVTVQESPA